MAYSWYLWVLPSEITTVNSVANVGAALGATISMLLSGPLLGNGYSWATFHYVCGSIILVICLAWWVFADNTPEETVSKFRPLRFSKRISSKDRLTNCLEVTQNH